MFTVLLQNRYLGLAESRVCLCNQGIRLDNLRAQEYINRVSIHLTMLFWKRNTDTIIQCPNCEWKPDGEKHWACSCGHSWNTFETKAKCPQCKKQWQDTVCPGCGKLSPHKSWYKTREEINALESAGDSQLRAKKKSLESRLVGYGIKNYRVSHLPYLDHSNEKFHSPFEAGCRMMILYAISYAVHKLHERADVCDWLQREGLWDRVSPKEKEFFTDPLPEKETLRELSWRIEAALTLGWCLNKVKVLPRLDETSNKINGQAMREFQENVPALGEPLMSFLSNLEYRSLDEIYEENLVNEMATTYFRDLMFSRKDDQTKINRAVSLERHRVLNWLRTHYEDGNFSGELWDDVDTST